MAIVTNRSNVGPTSSKRDEVEGDADVPLGTFLHGALPAEDVDSVRAVRELRERER